MKFQRSFRKLPPPGVYPWLAAVNPQISGLIRGTLTPSLSSFSKNYAKILEMRDKNFDKMHCVFNGKTSKDLRPLSRPRNTGNTARAVRIQLDRLTIPDLKSSEPHLTSSKQESERAQNVPASSSILSTSFERLSRYRNLLHNALRGGICFRRHSNSAQILKCHGT